MRLVRDRPGCMGEIDMESLFETEHLKVRTFLPEDARRLYENHVEDETREWMPGSIYSDIKETLNAISFYKYCIDNAQFPYVLAVESKETLELIGDIGVNGFDGRNDAVEIGYSICKEHSGKGYATELVRAMNAYATDKLNADAIYGRVRRGNDAYVRVLVKSGYQYEMEESGAEDDPAEGMLIYKRVGS